MLMLLEIKVLVMGGTGVDVLAAGAGRHDVS